MLTIQAITHLINVKSNETEVIWNGLLENLAWLFLNDNGGRMMSDDEWTSSSMGDEVSLLLSHDSNLCMARRTVISS